jgi:geranylgeranyl diphosphate synthase, type II
MLTLKECQIITEKQINELDMPLLPSNLYEPVRYMLDLGGKRFRPSLVLMGCNVFSDDITPAMNPALAIEIFHNFTLMHDDIMDRSEMRRNKLTVHKKWNQNIAILSGDVMIIKSYELITKWSTQYSNQIMPVFNQMATQVCEGQQYDMDFEQKLFISIDEYLKMIELKTAVLIAASLKIGALAGKAEKLQSELLYRFGKNMGMAFQLQDDLLDVYAEEDVVGKQTGNDIVSNKKTILLVEALTRVKGDDLQLLIDWLKKSDFDRKEKIEAIKNIYHKVDIKRLVLNRIRFFYDQAMINLHDLKVEPDRKSELAKFSRHLLTREK